MPFVLRKIRQSRWFRHEEHTWLEEDEVQADTLLDLRTEDNALSVWLVEDDRSNLDRVVAALASACDKLQNLDYILFESTILPEIGINIEKSDGITPDEEANHSWHRNLIELSAQDLTTLASELVRTIHPQRLYKRDLVRPLWESVSSGYINMTVLYDKPSFHSELQKAGYPIYMPSR